MSEQLSVKQPMMQFDVSVIIPTYNRADSLRRTLNSLARQTYPADRYEVIVVNDGGNDVTAEVVQMTFPFKLLYRYQTNKGSAVARNQGAQQSSGDILVFIDDDITLHPGYLAAITDRTIGATITMGLWEPYKPPNPSCFSEFAMRRIKAQAASATHDEVVPFTECTSNNLGIRRADFARVGMWQDVLGDGPTLWGDVEFGYRAWKKGCNFVRVADARLVHRDQHITDLASATKRAYHVSMIVQPLFALHPEIKRHLAMFRDKAPVEWLRDSPALILRKLARQVASSRPVMWIMGKSVPALERYAPTSTALRLLYRWIVSGYIYRGYREGLHEYEAAGKRARKGTP